MEKNTLTLAGDEKIAVLTLSRPHCLDIAGKHALLDAVNSLAERPNLRALIIAATDAQAWLVNVAELVDMTPAEARAFSHAGHQLADALADLPVPVIAAVHGVALGGGCELVLACDITLAGTMARFGQIEAMGGVLPAFGGT
jgi:enoyl-CoA hydratase